MKAKLEDTGRPGWVEVARQGNSCREWLAEWDALEVVDGVLCCQWVSDTGGDSRWLPAVPGNLQPEVLRQLHDGAGGAHFGRQKALQKVKERYTGLIVRRQY